MMRFRYLLGPPGERGSIAPIVALGLLAFVGFLALGIDLGQLQVVRNDLQNAADGAALAAAKKLIQDKNGDGVAEVYCDEAITAAINCANKNNSLGLSDPITITAADVIVGKWDLNTKSFERTGCSTNPSEVDSVQVRVRRTAEANNQVQTFLGSALGVADKRDVSASATAYMGPAGTSAIDVPFAVSNNYPIGGGPLTSNGIQRLLEKLGPAPAYATDAQTYQWYDLGGSNLDTTRATMVVPESAQLSLTYLQRYLKGEESNGLRFPQKKVGDKLYPISEYKWGSNVKSNYTLLKTRWNNNKDATTGKWRVTVAVYATDEVTSYLPKNSWFQLALRLLPGVSQAHACAAYYTPAVYTQGFMTMDITNVYVKTNCNRYSNQVTDPDSCRNTCYMEIEVPLNQNTVSSDNGSNPAPYKKTYKDMNPGASEVAAFSKVPKIVK